MQGNHPLAGLRKFCKKYFISWQRMREWFDIHDQLERIIRQHKEITGKNTEDQNKAKNQKKNNSRAADSRKSVSPAAVHQALTAGFLRNIGMRKQKNSYQISGNREVVLFPGSGLYNRGGQWIVAADFIHTSQLFARVVANIDVSWLERLGGDLCKRSWSDPHWQKKAGQVMALEKVSLFGLLLVAGRRVNYGRINATTAQEAREIFIREALIAGQLTGNYPFLHHNLDLSQRFSEMEDRLRKRSILTDDQVLYDFYDQRLGQVYDRFTLNRFLSRKEHKTNKKFLWMKEEDVCQLVPDSDELYRFPETLETSQGALRLHYRFQPGHEEDGITVDVPASCYPALSPACFEWLVPGLLDEKIFFLLKGLPKRLRRMFVPLPDAVDRIMDGMENRKGSLYPSLEQVILRCFQVTIVRSDWQIDSMPLHLRMRFRLCDEQGKTLHCSRNFHELGQYCLQSQQLPVRRKGRPGSRSTAVSKIGSTTACQEMTGITCWDFISPPEPVPVLDRQNRIIGMQYPALKIIDSGHDRSLTLFYTTDFKQACQANRAGLRFFYGLQFTRELRAIKKECKAAVAGHTASWMSLGLRATAAELKTMLFHAVLDSLFTTDRPLAALPAKEEVDSCIAILREQGITGQARSFLAKVLDLLAVRRQTQAILTRSRQRAAKSRSLAVDRYGEFQTLLDQLLPPDFLNNSLNPELLLDTKRYLQALASRIERAEHAPHKDVRKAERIQPVLEQIRQLDLLLHKMQDTNQVRSTACIHEITRFRRMVEEYRISVFAPEVGTAIPVSEKRLQQQWQNITNSCHSME
jgi:ATP-dependent helicase HrpA